MAINGISSALSALQRQSLVVDRAAARIARVGLGDDSAPASVAASPQVDEGSSFLEGATGMLVGTRLFTAALRMAQTTNENILAALRVGGYALDEG